MKQLNSITLLGVTLWYGLYICLQVEWDRILNILLQKVTTFQIASKRKKFFMSSEFLKAKNIAKLNALLYQMPLLIYQKKGEKMTMTIFHLQQI